MNIFLWVLQVMLAFTAIAGGAYKVFKYEDVMGMPFYFALPRAGWSALGLLEVACGLLLIVPGLIKKMPALTAHAAAVLAVESLALAALYAHYSLDMAATNPLVWVLVAAVEAAIVAYGRYVLEPLR